MTEAEDLIKIASDFFKQGDFDSAIVNLKLAQKLNAASSVNAEDITVYNNLALAYSKKGEIDLALRNYKKVIEKDSTNFKAYANIGNLYTEKKKLKEALTYLNKAISLNPNYVLTHYFIGNYRLKSGDYDLAIASYKKAKSLGSKSAKLYYGMGMAYKYKGEFALCANCMKLVLESNPHDRKAQIILSKVIGISDKMKKFNKIYKEI